MIATLIEAEDNTGDLILPISQEILDQVGWKEGDTLVWNDNGDGTFTLTKKQETELVLVETISSFKHRYLVEVPKGHKEYALDTVTLDEATELTQTWIGEQICGHRVVSQDNVLDVVNEEPDGKYITPTQLENYIKAWK